MEGGEVTRVGPRPPGVTRGCPGEGGLGWAEAMGLPLGTPPGWWPWQGTVGTAGVWGAGKVPPNSS